MANRSYSYSEFLHAGMILPKFFADLKILTIRGRTKKLAPKTRFQGPRRITGKSQRNKKILVSCENLGKNIHKNALKPLLNSFFAPQMASRSFKKIGKNRPKTLQNSNFPPKIFEKIVAWWVFRPRPTPGAIFAKIGRPQRNIWVLFGSFSRAYSLKLCSTEQTGRSCL